MKKVNLDKWYRCVGENFKNSIQIGFCGDEKRLIDFLMICFPGYEENYIRNYFREDTEKMVLEYLLANGGKRLIACKKYELADTIIRIFDICGYYEIDIEKAMQEKMAYNKERAYKHGGKII